MKKLLFFILGGLATFVLNLWFENASDSFYKKYVEPFFSKSFDINIATLFIIIIGLTSLFIYLKNTKDIATKKLQSDIDSLEDQLKDGSRALWKYFKDISEVKNKQIIEEVMKDFISKEPNVLGIQIYEYSIKNYRNYRKVYVSHKYSEVPEDIDLNALITTSYQIEKNFFNSYKKVRGFLEGNYINAEKFLASIEFATQTIAEISNKLIADLTPEDAIKLIYAEIVLDLCKKVSNSGDDTNYEIIADIERLEHLKRLKRTGILKGIEIRGELVFENTSINYKNGRQYITKVIEDNEYLNKRDYIILITLNPIEDEENQVFIDMINEFNTELNNALKVRYNEGNPN